jgi:hypothetical protein
MEYIEIAAKRRKKRRKSCVYAPFVLFRGYSFGLACCLCSELGIMLRQPLLQVFGHADVKTLRRLRALQNKDVEKTHGRLAEPEPAAPNSCFVLDWIAGPTDITNVSGGRTGFDLRDAPEAACRGWFVGLVKNRTKS